MRLYVNLDPILPSPTLSLIVHVPHDPPQHVALPNQDNNRKWESKFKLNIPEFYVNPNAEEFSRLVCTQ